MYSLSFLAVNEVRINILKSLALMLLVVKIDFLEFRNGVSIETQLCSLIGQHNHYTVSFDQTSDLKILRFNIHETDFSIEVFTREFVEEPVK